MDTAFLTGRELAAGTNAETLRRATALAEEAAAPRLVLVVATDDPASAWYVSSLQRAAKRCGITCDTTELGISADAATIRGALSDLSADASVDAVMLQTPLPSGVVVSQVSSAIDAGKDVDGIAPLSMGLLVAGLPGFAPATAAAVIEILQHHKVELAGRQVAVVGRSAVVGKPLVQLLLAQDATVTVCHSRTSNLPAVTSTADIVVAAAGRAGLITAEHVRPGAVVIDVGTNPGPDGGIVGDVDAASVTGRAAGLSPVPGGVGPVTTALLMRHTVAAAERRRKK